MSHLADQISYYYKLGGLRLILQVIQDKIKGQSITKERIYRLNSIADPKDYPEITRRWYKFQTGKELNLDNPRSFNDKIQWMKLFDDAEYKTILADKYKVREWVSSRIGEEYLVKLLGVWDTFEEIDFSRLPNSFVLKANHGSAWNIVVPDKNQFDIEDARKKFNRWMHTNYSFVSCFEMQYSKIEPKIIAEEFLDSLGEPLTDYKFHCFNGEPKIIEVIGERIQGTHKGREAVMTPDWKRHPGRSLITMSEYEDDPPMPKNYNRMLEIVRTLSEDFIYVRVDLYNIDGIIKFGEMTFTPASGTDPTDEYFTYADLIDLSKINKS